MNPKAETQFIWRFPDGKSITLVLSRRARTRVTLQLTRQGGIKLSVPPGWNVAEFAPFINDHQDWIARQQTQNPAATLEQHSLDAVYYLGHALGLYQGGKGIQEMVIQADRIVFSPFMSMKNQYACVTAWLREEAGKLILNRVNQLARQVNTLPAKISLSQARRSWGTCSSNRHVLINWRLIQAPPAVMDYVIYHELAHLIHANHGKGFWAQVEKWCPDWRTQRVWLKQHGEKLLGIDLPEPCLIIRQLESTD